MRALFRKAQEWFRQQLRRVQWWFRGLCAPGPSAYRIVRYRDQFRIVEQVFGPFKTKEELEAVLTGELDRSYTHGRLLVRSRRGIITEVARWVPVVRDPIAQPPVPPRDSKNG